jgi:hypothetical protein
MSPLSSRWTITSRAVELIRPDDERARKRWTWKMSRASGREAPATAAAARARSSRARSVPDDTSRHGVSVCD